MLDENAVGDVALRRIGRLAGGLLPVGAPNRARDAENAIRVDCAFQNADALRPRLQRPVGVVGVNAPDAVAVEIGNGDRAQTAVDDIDAFPQTGEARLSFLRHADRGGEQADDR